MLQCKLNKIAKKKYRDFSRLANDTLVSKNDSLVMETRKTDTKIRLLVLKIYRVEVIRENQRFKCKMRDGKIVSISGNLRWLSVRYHLMKWLLSVHH